MPRRPLTEEQLRECVARNGNLCPRCGETEDLEFGDPEFDENDAVCRVGFTCNNCNEEYRVVYAAKRAESVEE